MLDGEELLTDDEREYFYNMEAMFNSKGWDQLLREYDNERKTLPVDKFWEVKSYEELVGARVRLAILEELANYADHVETRKQGIIRMRQAELDSYE